MKKFNLLKEIIIVDESELSKAVNSQKKFGIALDGTITYTPDEEIVIFKAQVDQIDSLSLSSQLTTIQKIFGESYKIAKKEGKIGIKASYAFREIVKLNYNLALYDDTSADGVFEFADKKLEEIGWHADEFGISYRELIEELEERAKGVLLCIEQEKPSYQFSGLGFVDDVDAAYELLFSYARKRVEKKIKEDPLYKKENLSSDEKEAAHYFGVL